MFRNMSFMTSELMQHMSRNNPNFTMGGNDGTPGSAANPVQNPASNTGLGTLNYNPNASRDYNASRLPLVQNPDDALADIAQQQHNYLIREFRPFEQALLDSVQDTSIVDAVSGDVEEQSRIAREIDERNRSRYGYDRTAVENREIGREAQRVGNIALAGGLNTARLAQRSRNKDLMAGLVNIGQDINRGSMQQLSSAAEGHLDRENAYRSARAAAKAQRWGFLGSI